MMPSFSKSAYLALLICCLLNSNAWAKDYANPELEKANKLIDSGNSGEALGIVKKMIQEKNASPEAYELYPIILFFDDAYEVNQRAFQCARTAARANPKDDHILATFAMVLGDLKKYEEGIKIINRALEINPKSARSHAIAAMLYKKVEDIPAAKSQMEEALRLDPKDRDVNYLATKFYWETLEGNKLEETYKRWLKTNPKSALAHYKTSVFYRDMRRTDDAVAECKKAIALNEKYMLARLTMQSIVFKQKKYKEAAELFTSFMKHCFASYTTYSPRAECYSRLNQPQKAIDDYTTAINMRTKDIQKEGIVKLGKHMDKNEKKDHVAWWIARSQEYMKVGKRKKAIEDMNLLVQAFPGSASVLYARAKIFEEAGMNDLALKDADSLTYIDKDVTEWYRFKAKILKKMGRLDEAAKTQQKANTLEEIGK